MRIVYEICVQMLFTLICGAFVLSLYYNQFIIAMLSAIAYSVLKAAYKVGKEVGL